MDIKSFVIYGFGRLIPDYLWIKMNYWKKFHKFPNLRNPKTFNEKLTWMKLNDRNPLYTQMVDKLAAKDYVKQMIGGGYIIPTLEVWDSPDEINIEELPDKFVLKCTHNSGGTIICRDKKSFDLVIAKNKLGKSYGHNYFWLGREWPYKNVNPRGS